jgi:transposase-like protein
MLNEHLGKWLKRWRLRKIDLESTNQVGIVAELSEANCLVGNNPEDEPDYFQVVPDDYKLKTGEG